MSSDVPPDPDFVQPYAVVQRKRGRRTWNLRRDSLTPISLAEKRAARAQLKREVGPTALLVGLTDMLPYPRIAFMGLADPISLLKVSYAAMRRQRKDWFPRENPVTVFAWDALYAAWKAASDTLYKSRKIPNREKDLADVLQFVCASTGRLNWAGHIDRCIREKKPAYGMIVHTGSNTGTDIRGDLDCLLPMMDDATLVVLMNLRRDGPQNAFEGMVRSGWHGLRLGPTFDIGVLQMPATPAKETDNARTV